MRKSCKNKCQLFYCLFLSFSWQLSQPLVLGQLPPLLLHQQQDLVLAPPILVRYTGSWQRMRFTMLTMLDLETDIKWALVAPYCLWINRSCLSCCLLSLVAGFGGLGTGNTTAGGFSFGGFGLNANPAAVSFNVGCFGTATTTGTVFNFGNSLASTGIDDFWMTPRYSLCLFTLTHIFFCVHVAVVQCFYFISSSDFSHYTWLINSICMKRKRMTVIFVERSVFKQTTISVSHSWFSFHVKKNHWFQPFTFFAVCASSFTHTMPLLYIQALSVALERRQLLLPYHKGLHLVSPIPLTPLVSWDLALNESIVYTIKKHLWLYMEEMVVCF